MKLFPDPLQISGWSSGAIPMGNPTPRRPSTDFRVYFIVEILVGIKEALVGGQQRGFQAFKLDDFLLNKGRHI